MNQTHIHLLINHLPVFGSILGAVVLAYALFTRNDQSKNGAYLVFILSAIGAVVAYLTGEAAEEVVEEIQGVSHNLIHEHEDAALFALISFILLGLASIYGIFLSAQKSTKIRIFAKIVLVLALFSFTVVARTAYLGGEIRHTEIHQNTIDDHDSEN